MTKNYTSKKNITVKSKKTNGGSVSSDLVSQLSASGDCQLDYPNKHNLLSNENILSNYGSFYKTTGGGKRKDINGGSIASDLVMELVGPSSCQRLPENVLNVLQKDFIISNYGSSFKTTGGGQKKLSLKKKSSFNENLISKTLSNIKQFFQNKVSMTNMLSNIKNYWNKNINFKLSTKNARTIISNLFKSNYQTIPITKKSVQLIKKGGARTVLPMRWFNPNYPDTYITQQSNCGNCPTAKTLPPYYENVNSYPYYNKSCMVGAGRPTLKWTQDTNGTGYRVDGDSVWMGSSNPENISQKFKNEMTGVTTMFKPSRGSVTVSEAQYMCNSTNCAPESNSFQVTNPTVQVSNINTDSAYSLDMPYTSGVVWPSDIANPTGDFSSQGLRVPNQRAGGRKKSMKKKQGKE